MGVLNQIEQKSVDHVCKTRDCCIVDLCNMETLITNGKRLFALYPDPTDIGFVYFCELEFQEKKLFAKALKLEGVQDKRWERPHFCNNTGLFYQFNSRQGHSRLEVEVHAVDMSMDVTKISAYKQHVFNVGHKDDWLEFFAWNRTVYAVILRTAEIQWVIRGELITKQLDMQGIREENLPLQRSTVLFLKKDCILFFILCTSEDNPSETVLLAVDPVKLTVREIDLVNSRNEKLDILSDASISVDSTHLWIVDNRNIHRFSVSPVAPHKRKLPKPLAKPVTPKTSERALRAARRSFKIPATFPGPPEKNRCPPPKRFRPPTTFLLDCPTDTSSSATSSPLLPPEPVYLQNNGRDSELESGVVKESEGYLLLENAAEQQELQGAKQRIAKSLAEIQGRSICSSNETEYDNRDKRVQDSRLQIVTETVPVSLPSRLEPSRLTFSSSQVSTFRPTPSERYVQKREWINSTTTSQESENSASRDPAGQKAVTQEATQRVSPLRISRISRHRGESNEVVGTSIDYEIITANIFNEDSLVPHVNWSSKFAQIKGQLEKLQDQENILKKKVDKEKTKFNGHASYKTAKAYAKVQKKIWRIYQRYLEE
ncbi:hypothetical protein L596_022182 [Steinernema carpocapsae]|uniref:Uncharacterized protein n=1 Tax=Steinernema carpocapsae TaxID=34508 RepID=A0A4U5ML28_STECR|nr:hypothetical protein L596_022182 [Steinernema carpocapsae]